MFRYEQQDKPTEALRFARKELAPLGEADVSLLRRKLFV